MTLNADTRKANTRRILDEINAQEQARKALERITPDSRYPMLSQAEARFMNHMAMWGAQAYPIKKVSANKWMWTEFCSVEGTPVLYKTKTKAADAIELYLETLRDRVAGRL